MKGEDCLIYRRADIKKLMDFLKDRFILVDKNIYIEMQKAGVLDIYSQIQSDVREQEDV